MICPTWGAAAGRPASGCNIQERWSDLELRDSQYQAALKYMRGADDALQQAISATKNKKGGQRIGRTLDEITVLLKKAKKELGSG
jgi:hypothetical protein